MIKGRPTQNLDWLCSPIEHVQGMAWRLNERFIDSGIKPLFVIVLNGAARFGIDMINQLEFDYDLDFITVKSYEGIESTGKIEIVSPAEMHPKGRTVILLEDVVDSGLTVKFLRDYYKLHQAETVEVHTLVWKLNDSYKKNAGEAPEAYGLVLGNRFIVGYGMDCDGEGRGLNDIYML